jgi:hypothetical protein
VEPATTRERANLITVHPTPEWVTILRQAGVDLLAYDRAPASQVGARLAEAARRILRDPSLRHPLRPAGEPLAGFDAVRLLEWAAERCARCPGATFRVKIRSADSGPRWRG